MAKVTARGDEVAMTWTGANNRRMVWTRRGRLLIRHAGSRRYAILRTSCSQAEAERLAGVHMMARL